MAPRNCTSGSGLVSVVVEFFSNRRFTSPVLTSHLGVLALAPAEESARGRSTSGHGRRRLVLQIRPWSELAPLTWDCFEAMLRSLGEMPRLHGEPACRRSSR